MASELQEAVQKLPCQWIWRGNSITPCDDPELRLPLHAWCPTCRCKALLRTEIVWHQCKINSQNAHRDPCTCELLRETLYKALKGEP